MPNVTCFQCGDRMRTWAVEDKHKFCSGVCLATYRSAKAEKVARKAPRPRARMERGRCRVCGTTDGMDWCAHFKSIGMADTYCRQHWNAYCREKQRIASGWYDRDGARRKPTYAKLRSCLDCGIDFHLVNTAIRCNPCQVVVDAERRGAAYALRRLAKKKGDTSITQHLLGERDNWTCHLCGEPVPQFTHCIDGQSATIDHIVPLVRGGSHTWDNVRLAHRSCNSARGAKPLEAAWTAGAPKPSSFATS